MKASAPGKAILFGEYIRSYGKYTIATALDTRTYADLNRRRDDRVHIVLQQQGVDKYMSIDECIRAAETADSLAEEKKFEELENMGMDFLSAVKVVAGECGKAIGGYGFDLEIESELLPGFGTSSSAFSAVALAALAEFGLDNSRDAIAAIARKGDAIAHANRIPHSNIDSSMTTFGGYMESRGGGATQLKADMRIPAAVGHTQAPDNAEHALSIIQKEEEKNKARMDKTTEMMEKAGQGASNAISSGMVQRMGYFMNIAQAHLCELGVSCNELDEMVSIALANKAYGAKLIGEGQNRMIAIGGDVEKIVEEFREHGYNGFASSLGAEGARREDK